jgi:predicted dehydrogenase
LVHWLRREEKSIMTIRWGILGCGDIVRKRAAQAIRDEPHSRLVAACRRDAAKLRDFCRSFAVERAYTRDTDLLSDPGIDAVYIATPVHLHLPQTVAAAAAGKHVLVEKPMARSVAECQQMIAACRDRGVKLGVAYYRRFYPIVRRMKALLATGEIGRPLAVSAVTSTRFALGPGDDGYWRVRLPEGGGGALMDIGSHRIDLFLDLFGDIVEVKAFCDTVAADYDAEDTALVLVRFQAGLLGSLQCYFGTAVGSDEFTILGTNGRLSANPLNGRQLVVEQDGNRRLEDHPPAANLHGPLVADFVAAIRENRAPAISGGEGLRTNDVMERAYRAARMGNAASRARESGSEGNSAP